MLRTCLQRTREIKQTLEINEQSLEMLHLIVAKLKSVPEIIFFIIENNH